MPEPAAQRYDRLRHALGDRALPAVLVDLDALERNVATARAGVPAGVRIRLGSKSIRSVGLIARIAAGLGDAYGGVLGFHAREALHLVRAGLRDVLVAYPTAHPADLDALATCAAEGATVTAMVDDRAQVAALSRVATARGVTVPVAIDVDMGVHAPGAVVIGVRRSPLRTADAVLALAEEVARAPGVALRGFMGYEAQVAGMPDRDARGRTSLVAAAVKAVSRGAVRARRAAVRDALRRKGFDVVIANGGGTGSLRFTASDPAVNEVVVGSGFVGSHLFDGLDEFAAEPAMCFALPVSRRPAPDVVTCLGGGWVASGAAGPDRLPRPWLPDGLALLPMEGAGEVQTPVRGDGARGLAVGDPVFFRHGKAGEPGDRVASYLLVRGDAVVDEVSTYRGDGLALV